MSTRADPLTAVMTRDRVNYATGSLLGAEDFTAEQIYHRSQLARALANLDGSGTVAGLRVVHEPATATRVERLLVQPGLAVDRIGRLIEVPRTWCIRLGTWFAAQTEDGLTAGFHEDITVDVPDDAADPPADAPVTVDGVVADVFLRFSACPRGLTPAFHTGPFDALDAVAPSRIRDGFELELVLRDDPEPRTPETPSEDVAAIGDPAARARATRKAVLNAWNRTDPLPPQIEHKLGMDPAALFLARIIIPANEGPPVTRRNEPVVVDNYSREFVLGTPALSRFLGL